MFVISPVTPDLFGQALDSYSRWQPRIKDGTVLSHCSIQRLLYYANFENARTFQCHGWSEACPTLFPAIHERKQYAKKWSVPTSLRTEEEGGLSKLESWHNFVVPSFSRQPSVLQLDCTNPGTNCKTMLCRLFFENSRCCAAVGTTCTIFFKSYLYELYAYIGAISIFFLAYIELKKVVLLCQKVVTCRKPPKHIPSPPCTRNLIPHRAKRDAGCAPTSSSE